MRSRSYERGTKISVESANVSQSHPIVIWLLGLVVTVIILVSLRRKPKISFYCVISAALTWGVILFLYVPPYFNPELSHSLADAFVIAALLAATVDQYVKGRVLHEVTTDVSKYLIGYRLPEQLQDRLRSIMQTKWIRRSYEMRMRLRELHDNTVELDLTISDSVQNITSETQEYIDSLTFSKFERFEIIELRCDGGNDVYHFSGQELQRQEESGQLRHWGKGVKIPPASESLHDFRFSTRYKALHPLSSKETFTFSQPTIGAVVELTDCPPEFLFHLTPTPDTSAHRRWTYNRLFLPGEQISIQWEKQAEVAK